MRTTLNIDDALMHDLKERADSTHRSLSAVVNDILAAHLRGSSEETQPFRQKTYALGARPGINFHKSLDLAAELETDYTIDKLELRK
jgi:plasmid stability protein